ncbi:putrescine:proton symporter, AAT family [Candidatus Koribacter versatilis Ellin345]|uniref:Putrescine:proton symporter, AAT family n=1 Tax=Koribacter versatilis (strain Ellin345) TaxID=204669 RepID=Q1IM83_KORVE|nr:APC family permease [Candidatus Koribacter versatilis]ABF42017.1 putrescine:proton symporter, AAT family [Candidatus Koribacter versatilis Ellin345]
MEESRAVTATNPQANTLKRSLGLWDLILYGIIVIQPTAPMPAFGVFSNGGKGHVVTSILIAMIAMVFTAMSYGRMARVYPSAGSAYTYVGRELHPALGYVTGWSMTMDYMLNPLICTIWCAHTMADMIPGIPLGWVLWTFFFAILFTGLNLRGIQTSARINQILCAIMAVVIAAFFVATVRYIFHLGSYPSGYFTHPFFNPDTFSVKTVFHGTSLAVLTYIGFDGISTLSEEVENPRRNIFLATVLVCVITGALAAAEVYGAQLLRYDWHFEASEEITAFAHVAAIAGGAKLANAIGITLLIATIGSGMGAQLGAARLLYGMGRSEALPKKFFGAIHPKTRIPANNVLLVGGIALVGAFLMNYDRGAELLNFGALLAFMGVNLAALTHYFLRDTAEPFLKRFVVHFLPSALGFVICLAIWLNLTHKALLLGAVWMVVGIAYGAVRTKFFRAELVNFDIPSEE